MQALFFFINLFFFYLLQIYKFYNQISFFNAFFGSFFSSSFGEGPFKALFSPTDDANFTTANWNNGIIFWYNFDVETTF